MYCNADVICAIYVHPVAKKFSMWPSEENVFALRIYKIKSIFLHDFKFTE